MKLTIEERLTVLDGDPEAQVMLLPTGGRADTIRSLRRLKEALAFSDEEIERLDLRFEPMVDGQGRETGAGRWFFPAKSRSETAEIEFPPIVQAEIVKKLSELEANGHMTDRLLSLWEKFVEAPGSTPAPKEK